MPMNPPMPGDAQKDNAGISIHPSVLEYARLHWIQGFATGLSVGCLVPFAICFTLKMLRNSRITMA